MNEEERRVAEPLVGKAIAEAATVFPEDRFTAWATRWLAGDEEARSRAETIRKLVPQLHVDPIPSEGQVGNPFLQTLEAYARATGHDPHGWMEPDTWLALASRVRSDHPDTISDESKASIRPCVGKTSGVDTWLWAGSGGSLRAHDGSWTPRQLLE